MSDTTTADIARVRASDGATEVIAALQHDGAVIVDGFVDDDLLARLNAELDPLLADAALGDERQFINDAIAWFFGSRVRHVSGVPGKSRVFAEELLVHPIWMAVCDELLRPRCADYVLNLAHVLDRGPGADEQFHHRDELVWNDLPKDLGEVQVASILALTDFTAENGATVVVPGSHRWERERVPQADEFRTAVMPAGSAVVYLGSTIHAGGANTTTDSWRRGMHVSYCLGWLRTEENQFLANPIETVRDLPRRNLELLGYGAHDALSRGGGYLGTVELQHPVDVLGWARPD